MLTPPPMPLLLPVLMLLLMPMLLILMLMPLMLLICHWPAADAASLAYAAVVDADADAVHRRSPQLSRRTPRMLGARAGAS